MPAETWWLYVVLTNRGDLYCGISLDVHRRVRDHNLGRGAKRLRGSHLPVHLLMTWCFEGEESHSNALKAEAWFKRQRRSKKVSYVKWDEPLPRHLGYSFGAQQVFTEQVDHLLQRCT